MDSVFTEDDAACIFYGYRSYYSTHPKPDSANTACNEALIDRFYSRTYGHTTNTQPGNLAELFRKKSNRLNYFNRNIAAGILQVE